MANLAGTQTAYLSMDKSRISSLFSVSCFLFQCFIAGLASSIGTDKSALLALKSHISFSPNNVLERNWSADSSVCNWIGVICNRRHGRVAALDISDMGLSGTIPPQVGNLSFLTSLDIGNNSLYGNLPEELAKLHRLEFLTLSRNNFSGAVPTFFSFIPNLQFLYLSHNKFTGRIPSSVCNISKLQQLTLNRNFLQGTIPVGIGDLHSLTFLNLEGNQLTGRIPSSIFNISSLEILAATGNKLSGKLPGDICHNLPKLERLYLSRNYLYGLIPPSLQKCSQLGLLSISNNEFTGTIPREIGNLTILTVLFLGANSLEGSVPMEIGNLPRLEIFGIGYSGLRGSIPATIFNISTLQGLAADQNGFSGALPSNLGKGLPNLEWLYLAGNKFSGNIPDSISNSSKLTILELSDNSFSGPIPNSLGNLGSLAVLNLGDNNFTVEPSNSELSFLTSLTNCVHLKELVISENPLNGILPSSLGNFSSLQKFAAYRCKIGGQIPEKFGNLSKVSLLAFSYNKLSGVIPITFDGLQNLQELYLANNYIRGPLPSTICNLPNLGNIDLSGNRISGTLPTCIGNITRLRNINLASNNFTSSLPSSLWLLQDLLKLNASRNLLSGHLPPEIGNLKVITLIDLSMNNFSGNIPGLVGGLQNLIELSLAHNELEGPIPDSLGKVLSLEVLDLSYNMLTGIIPPSLEALYLKKFNVSFNKLSGEIPAKGPFRNFTSQSFMPNGALCGGPQFNFLPCSTFSPHSRRKRLLVVVYVLLGISSLVLLAILGIFLIRRHKKRQPTLESGPSPALEHERIPYHDLQRSTNGFSESNLLGKGSYGSVYEGTFNNDILVAVKVFNSDLAGAFRSFDTECDVLRNLRHRNLAKVITCCSTEDFRALVLEYMPNGSLEKWLYSHNYFLDILQRLDIMIDVASAVDYLHNGYSMSVVHCDLKPSNVLLDKDMVAHVSDFGIAKLLSEDSIAQTKTLATIGYIAPEYGQGGLVSTKCDVYSFGIMLIETFTRMKPDDEMFAGDMSLRSWIKGSVPSAIMQVGDPNLLKPEKHSFDAKIQCLLSLMELALESTAEVPDARINIQDVLSRLQKIRLQFITISGGR